MREILFRGKRKDNGEWVEGYLCRKYFQEPPHDRLVIQYKTKPEVGRWTPDYMVAEVIPETVDQYTGQKNTTGARIFEGDIIKNIDGVSLVIFDKTVSGFCMRFFDAPDDTPLDMGEMWDDSEIIGNIHDNPELLVEVRDE